MDFGTIGGIIGGFVLLVGSILFTGGDIFNFANISAVFTTVGGTIAAIFVAFPMARLLQSFIVVKHAFSSTAEQAGEIINVLVNFSEKARREGLLALEDDIEDVTEPFLKKGVHLVVDGTDPELVKSIMLTDIEKMEARHQEGKSLFDMAGLLAPAFGMIGTLIGLIQMLANLTDKASIGTGMALALITTLYGAVLSNLVFQPIARKLAVKSYEEVLLKEVILEGTLSIQSGDNPRVVKDKLTSFLAPNVRAEIAAQID